MLYDKVNTIREHIECAVHQKEIFFRNKTIPWGQSHATELTFVVTLHLQMKVELRRRK